MGNPLSIVKVQLRFSVTLLCLLSAFATAGQCSDTPKQTPANTVNIHVDPVKPQVFPQKTTFFINRIVDRSGNPQPLLAYSPRGGVFFDREPSEIVRQALEDSFNSAGMLAPDAASADLTMDVYLFEFGLAKGSGFEFFAKVELNVVLKNNSGAKSQPVTALGTSIQGRAILKSNIQKNVTVNVEEALQDATRNLLRGVKLRDAVLGLEKPASPGEKQPAASPIGEPLSKAEILKLLKSDAASPQLAALVKQRGISFTPTSDDLAEIRGAGGKDDLIEALAQTKPN
ncbi:MAG TPA: hypothetical protein VI685_02590 [Candidatus Angelobacter sp.]